MTEHLRRCFTIIHCELHSKCELAHVDYRNGYFQPVNVGEHCHVFKPLVADVRHYLPGQEEELE